MPLLTHTRSASKVVKEVVVEWLSYLALFVLFGLSIASLPLPHTPLPLLFDVVQALSIRHLAF